MRTLFKGGTVVSGQGTRPADVLVEGVTISAVGTDLSADGAQIVDCAGKLLFPGFIDAHTHFDLAVAGTVTADDFATGSRAALRGGLFFRPGVPSPGERDMLSDRSKTGKTPARADT